MHRRRPSHSVNPDTDVVDEQQTATKSPVSATGSSHPPSPAQKRRVRAASSALATIAIDTGLDQDTDSPATTQGQTHLSQAAMIRPSLSSSPLPSYQRSSPARSNARSLRLVSRFTLLLSFCFLALTAVFVFIPDTRARGKAAVNSLGGYAGHAWSAAGTGWESWRQNQPSANGGLSGGLSFGGHQQNVRVLPAAHPDPTKSLRCERSHDGQRSVVQYAIMIDAGSTGSRVHVYKFNYCSASPELENEVFEMLRPGLSSFKGNPRAAAESLRPLLATSMKSIPEALRGCSPIAVKATAGLRLLGQQQSNEILRAVRKMIKDEYPFVLADGPATKGVIELTPGGGEIEGKAVEIMDGRDEGVFAWITVNYLLGLIGPPLPGQSGSGRRQTAAVMDLGGASTQIVFEPAIAADPTQGMRPGEHVYALRNFGGSGQDYTLYQNSYLGYGLMQARRRVNTLAAFAHGYTHPETPGSGVAMVPSPCFAPGMSKKTKVAPLVHGGKDDIEVTMHGIRGGLQACRRLVDVMLDKDADCKAEPCSFAGVYQPKLLDAVTSAGSVASIPGVVALSYFYDRLYPLGLGRNGHGFTLGELEDVAKDVCAGPTKWPSRFSAEGLAELHDRPETCLDLVYMHSLLSLGYDLENKGGKQVQLRIEKQLAGIELGWALGAAVGMLGELDSSGHCKKLS
ncbi:unnamed protein product [Parajaminaea phylloscopi]